MDNVEIGLTYECTKKLFTITSTITVKYLSFMLYLSNVCSYNMINKNEE